MDALAVLRAVLGFVYVLFIPGFAASWAVYPRKDELSSIERVGLSFGLSLALSTLPVMFLNYLGVPMTEASVFLIILGVIVVCGVLAFVRGMQVKRSV